MKNKFNLRKLIFIFIGMFFCVIPIDAKAADYEASFKFYTADDSVILDMINDFNMWGMIIPHILKSFIISNITESSAV